MGMALGPIRIRSSHPVLSQETLKVRWEGP